MKDSKFNSHMIFASGDKLFIIERFVWEVLRIKMYYNFNKNELRYRAPNQDLLLNLDTTGIMVRCI